MIEQRGFPAWNSFPVTGPITSPARQMDTTMGGARITLTGTTFTVRVQISNAQAVNVPAHLFSPAESQWETYATVTQPDAPLDIPAPARWVRLILDSGTVTGGNVEESTRTLPNAQIAVQAASAISNTTLSQLAGKSQTAGVQFADGSRWLWQASGTANGGTVVSASGGGVWVREFFGPVNVKWFGAKGDGSDDTAAIQAAITYARAKVASTQILATLYFPVGYYRYTSTLKLDFRVNIEGEFGFGNAVTLVYDPPVSLLNTLTTNGGAVDPMSVPAILMTGTRTGGSGSSALANGLVDGGTASLLYGSRVNGVQLSTTGAAVRKVDGLVWRDCSEVMYDRLNINGEFRHGIVYWGVSILFANTFNISNCTNGIFTRSANATNWNIAAITAMHHHANLFLCTTAHHLTGSVRHYGASDSWQEFNQTHVRITATAKGLTDIDDLVFNHVQMSNGEAGITPDSRLMIIDLSAVNNDDPNHGVVRIKNVELLNVWSFLKESTKAIQFIRGSAGDVTVGRIILNGLNVYGMADAGVVFTSDMLIKVTIGSGGLTALKDWIFPLTPLATLKNAPVTFLGWQENAGGVLDTTHPSGSRNVTGRALAVYQNASFLLVHVDYPPVTGVAGGVPTVTVTPQEVGTYGGSTTNSYRIPVSVEARNVTTTGCDLAVYSVHPTGQFVVGDQVTLAFRVDGMTP